MKTLLTLILGVTIITPPNAQKLLDIEGAIKISDIHQNPEAGMIRWNEKYRDFEGYTGKDWVSFTSPSNDWGTSNRCATENQCLLGSEGMTYDIFGSAIEISGDYMLITAVATGDDWPNTATPGKGYIFQKVAGNWTEQQILTASDGTNGDFFGRGGSIDGDYAVVGADFHNSRQGAAYIYHRNGATWTEQAKIIHSDAASNDDFGWSVDIDGDYIISGAPWNDVPGVGNNSGRAYIFHRSGSSWLEQALLEASDATSQDLFGYRVKISGTIALVGTSFNETLGSPDQRSVYVFERTGTNWLETEKLVGSSSHAGDGFGQTMAIHGNRAIVGAPIYEENGIAAAGRAYIFEYDGSNWSEIAVLAPRRDRAMNYFGISVDITDEYAIVSSDGQVHVFCQIDGIWAEQGCLKASDLNAYQNFYLPRINDQCLVLGVPTQTVDGKEWQGKVYVYEKN